VVRVAVPWGILLCVDWNQQVVDGLDLALNEARVCGLRFDPSRAEASLLLEVLALPEIGPIDPDPRRVTVLSEVSSLEVILQREMRSGPGPVLPLESLDALETFFASLGNADAMYGWSFIDVADPSDNWKVSPSLLEQTSLQQAKHTLHWFTECGRPGPEDRWEGYGLQGVIHFESLRVERADSRSVPLEEFEADARRWSNAFNSRDARLSGDAQQRAQASATSWRSWGGSSVMVPGKPE
jgi:hypothetical protein